MRCTVAYAEPERQWLWECELPEPATVADALACARAQMIAGSDAARPAALDWDDAPVGIFGRSCGRTQPLRAGDRVEIYRPLAQDPKESRRERARRLRVRNGS